MIATNWKTSVLVIALAACGSSTPGARPHDMSAAEHERAATEHAQAAEAHAGHDEPNARARATGCSPTLSRPPICWTSIENPTAEDQRSAEEHRRLAAEHRAASAALRDAEARACNGIADEDRDISPFDRVEDIAGVETLNEGVGSKVRTQLTVGAVITFRARPGMTAEWLQRVVDCHVARNAALGHVVPEMPNCPLVPKGVQARVTSTGNGFAVAIRSDDPTVAQEILARARRSQAGQ
jgi:hypothetical protein